MKRHFNTFRIVLFITLFIKLFDVIKNLIISSKLGVSWEADVYLSIVSLPESIIILLGLDTIRGVVNSEFAHYEKEHSLEIGYTFSIIFNYLFIFSITIVIFLMFFKKEIINILFPGYLGDSLVYSIYLLTFILPILVFRTLSGYFHSILNAFENFYFPIITSIIISISVLFCLYVEEINNFILTRLAIGNLIGNCLFTLILLTFIYKRLKKYYFSFKINKFTKHIIKSCFTTFSLVVANQIYLYSRNYLASFYEQGTVASLSYSLSITSLINMLIFSSTFSVLITNISKYYLNNENENILKLINNTLGTLIFISSLVIVIFILNSREILNLLYKRGNFNEVGINMTILPFTFDSLSILGMTITSVMTAFYLGTKHYKLLTTLGIILYISGIILTTLLSKFYGYVGIPLAGAITMIIYGIILLFYTKKIILIPFKFIKNIIKILLIASITLIISEIVISFDIFSFVTSLQSFFKDLILLFLKSIMIVFIFLFFSWLLKIEYFRKLSFHRFH